MGIKVLIILQRQCNNTVTDQWHVVCKVLIFINILALEMASPGNRLCQLCRHIRSLLLSLSFSFGHCLSISLIFSYINCINWKALHWSSRQLNPHLQSMHLSNLVSGHEVSRLQQHLLMLFTLTFSLSPHPHCNARWQSSD